jgi:hypothetical protein
MRWGKSPPIGSVFVRFSATHSRPSSNPSIIQLLYLYLFHDLYLILEKLEDLLMRLLELLLYLFL